MGCEFGDELTLEEDIGVAGFRSSLGWTSWRCERIISDVLKAMSCLVSSSHNIGATLMLRMRLVVQSKRNTM
jgi:hypothetical protein